MSWEEEVDEGKGPWKIRGDSGRVIGPELKPNKTVLRAIREWRGCEEGVRFWRGPDS